MLRRSRESLKIEVPIRYAGIRYVVWQMLSVTFPDFGWSGKAFRVLSWNFDPDKGLVNLTLQEEGAGSYGWKYDDAALIPPAPDTTLVNPLRVPPPTNLLVVAVTAQQPDGTTAPALEVTWDGAAHPFVTGHEVQYRLAGGQWQSMMVPNA